MAGCNPRKPRADRQRSTDGLFVDLLTSVDYRPPLPAQAGRNEALMLNLDWMDKEMGLSQGPPPLPPRSERVNTDRIPPQRLQHLRRGKR